MTKYKIGGGPSLAGKVHLHGAKNAGFKIMIAALLGHSPSEICDLGLISEIDFTRQTIASLGGQVTSLSDPHCLKIDPGGLSTFAISAELSAKSRFAIMYMGPLLARFGRAVLPLPGGDTTIGRRPLDRHIDGLKALGASVDFRDNTYFFRAPTGLRGTNFRFPKNTHNGTEMLIVAAVGASGTTVLENAAAEPEVDDLIGFLTLLGADVRRVRPRTIRIAGGQKLGGAKYVVMKDRNEAVTFACAALATGGDVLVEGANESVLSAFLDKVTAVGGGWEKTPSGIRFYFRGKLVATDVETRPYPGFMTDWQPLWTTLMTQAEGESVIHETIYERRFDFVPGLNRMGAKITLFRPQVTDPDEFYNFNWEDDKPGDQHAAKVFGPTKLSGIEIEVNDVRSGATALLAGIIASGTTTIVDPKDQIKRGYECLPQQLKDLGANVQSESTI